MTPTVTKVSPAPVEPHYQITVSKEVAEMIYSFVGKIADGATTETSVLYSALRNELRTPGWHLPFDITINKYNNLEVKRHG